MTSSFRIIALSESLFDTYRQMTADELKQHKAAWLTVDANPGLPCRVSLEDARVGEKVLALSFQHLDVGSPYDGSGPIFVREQARRKVWLPGEVPHMLRIRNLSLRGYDHSGYMLEAEVVAGENLESRVIAIFDNPKVAYIHVHNASPGCFDCRVERV